MRVLSLFSGVGGFDMGLEAAGMTTAFQCEIDPKCQEVLRFHWPHVPKWDDVSTLTGRHILETVGLVDVVAWGSPCQDLSLAGKRAGLSGERSGLFHEGVRIIKELRELSNGKSPTWSVWENVVGALSSNGGADFGQVLWEMDEAGACFSEWVVVDAQYFGVPQRRRRVFVASCFDSGTSERCGSPLFPVSESLPRHFEKGAASRKGTAGTVEDSVGAGGIGDVVGTIGPTFGSKNYSNIQEVPQGSLVVEPVLVDGRRVDDVRIYTEPVQTLQERMGTGGNNVPVVAQEPIAFQPGSMSRLGGHVWEGGPVPTLRAESKRGDNEPHVAQSPLSFDTQFESNANVFEDQSPTLKASQQPPSVGHGNSLVVRRLTPLECERLMGWPDNHTAVGINEPISDTNRYKMCGNGVASPVAAWLAKHILNV